MNLVKEMVDDLVKNLPDHIKLLEENRSIFIAHNGFRLWLYDDSSLRIKFDSFAARKSEVINGVIAALEGYEVHNDYVKTAFAFLIDEPELDALYISILPKFINCTIIYDETANYSDFIAEGFYEWEKAGNVLVEVSK